MIIKLVFVCAAAIVAPAALSAGEQKAAEPVAVSSETAAASPAALVKGYRGTPIPVSGDQLLYVKTGDRIDLLVTFESAAEKDVKETVTATILQNIKVINVRRPEKLEETGAIELLVNPVEAQFAALSVAQGKSVNIVVRAFGDTELHPMEMASFRKLIK